MGAWPNSSSEAYHLHSRRAWQKWRRRVAALLHNAGPLAQHRFDERIDRHLDDLVTVAHVDQVPGSLTLSRWPAGTGLSNSSYGTPGDLALLEGDCAVLVVERLVDHVREEEHAHHVHHKVHDDGGVVVGLSARHLAEAFDPGVVVLQPSLEYCAPR